MNSNLVIKAILILAQSGQYTERDLYAHFDLLMGYSTFGARIDAWSDCLSAFNDLPIKSPTTFDQAHV